MITALIAGMVGGAVALATSKAAANVDKDVTAALKELHQTKCKSLKQRTNTQHTTQANIPSANAAERRDLNRRIIENTKALAEDEPLL